MKFRSASHCRVFILLPGREGVSWKLARLKLLDCLSSFVLLSSIVELAFWYVISSIKMQTAEEIVDPLAL